MSLRSFVAAFRGQREFHLDFIGRRRIWFLVSAILITLSIGALLVGRLNLGIDFRGGALLEYPNSAGVTTAEVREAMVDLGRDDAIVQIVDDRDVSVRTSTLGEERTEILETLAVQAGIQPAEINIQDIGPRWGEQISRKALQGLIVFLIIVSIYISLRFEWKMSASAIVALFHDLTITAGVFVLAGREVTPETVIAILTILGYSLYDTVVIFDKVNENTEQISLVSKETYSGAVNLSLNQVLMRSINTSLTTLLPIGTLLLFGGDTLQNFAFALFVGVAVGTYSSIFVAAPVLALLKEREPRMAQIRARVLRGRPATRPALRPVREPDEALEPAAAGPTEGLVARGEPAGDAPRQALGAQRKRGKKKPRSKRKRR